MELISIVMPVLNGEKYIEETINSVLLQTYKRFEFIIVDNGSIDNTLQIIKKYKNIDNRIKLFENKKTKSVAKSRNFAISNSKGDYVAFIDSDDLWVKDKLKLQYTIMNKNKKIHLTYCSYEMIDENSNVISKYKAKENITYDYLLKENVIGCSSVMVRKEVLKKFKFTDEFFHEDMVLWLKLLKNEYTFYGVDAYLLKYRLNKKSRSYNKLLASKNRWNIYRKSEKLSIVKSIYLFLYYFYNGIIKYSGVYKLKVEK